MNINEQHIHKPVLTLVIYSLWMVSTFINPGCIYIDRLVKNWVYP